MGNVYAVSIDRNLRDVAVWSSKQATYCGQYH